jgi:hypothetical protein
MNFERWFSPTEAWLLTEDFKTQREKFIAQEFRPDIVDNYLNTFKEIKDKKYKEIFANIEGVNVPPAQRTNIDAYTWFQELERVVDYVRGQRDLSKAKFTDIKFSGKPIYTGNGLEIYYADSPRACIEYKGNVPYSWCIARSDASNMFYTYRYKPHEPAFYFVKDLEKTKAEFGLWNATKTVFSGKFRDKYHFFVVQVVANANVNDPNKEQYIVTSAQNDGDQQMSWNGLVAIEPKLQGLQKVIAPKPLSSEERQDYERFKDGISDAAFSQLNYGEKNRYLDIAVRLDQALSTAQFQMLPDDLKNKYISFGVGLNKAQYEMIAQNKPLLKRYQDITIRKFEEALKTEHNINFQPSEVQIIINAPDFAEKMKETSNYDLVSKIIEAYPESAIKIVSVMLPETLNPQMIATIISFLQNINLMGQVGSIIIDKLGQDFNLEDMEALFGSEGDEYYRRNYFGEHKKMPFWEAMGEKLIQTKDLDDDEVQYLLELTKSEKLAQLLAAKHGKNLSYGAIVAMLHHVKSPEAAKMAMSMKDKLSPEDYQNLLKQHYMRSANEDQNRKAKEKFYSAVGHHADVITYPDGHRWVEGNKEHDPDSIKGDHTFYLISPSGEIEIGLQSVYGKVSVLHAEGKSVHSIMDKNPKIGKIEDLSQYYKHPSKWNDYIVDFITKKPDIVKKVHSISPDWHLGNLTPEQREKLFKERPDALPKVDFKTSDGYVWTNEKTYHGSNDYQLYDENWQPILSLLVDEHNDISRGSWHSPSISQMFTGKQEIDKNKFSKATAELILSKGFDHVDTREKSDWHWKFEDMLPEHQQMILEKRPNFTDPYSYVQKRSDSKEKSLALMGRGYGTTALDDGTVIIDDHNTIQERDLLSTNFFAKGLHVDSRTARKIVELLDKKIHGTYGENDKWGFEKFAKEGDLNTLKQKYPFADEEMMNLSREHGYRTSGALSHAIGKVVMPQVMKLLYEELKPYETDKFKVIFKDGKIAFVTSYDQMVHDYKKTHNLEKFMDEYRTWRNGLKVNWEDFLAKLDNIERNIDKEAFKNAISSYDAQSRSYDYSTNPR